MYMCVCVCVYKLGHQFPLNFACTLQRQPETKIQQWHLRCVWEAENSQFAEELGELN